MIGAWPEVHILHLEMLALVTEGSGLRPGAQDQIMGLMKTFVRFRRVGAGDVVFGANAAHESGDQPPAGDIVEDRVFLGYVERVVDQRQRPANHLFLYLVAYSAFRIKKIS